MKFTLNTNIKLQAILGNDPHATGDFNIDQETAFHDTGIYEKVAEIYPAIYDLCDSLMFDRNRDRINITGPFDVWTPSNRTPREMRNTYGLAVSDYQHEMIMMVYNELSPYMKKTGGSLAIISVGSLVRIRDDVNGPGLLTIQVSGEHNYIIKMTL